MDQFWNRTLVNMPDGGALTIGQLGLILLFAIVGYLGSRLIAYTLLKRLSKTKMRPDAVQILSRIVFWLVLIAVIVTTLRLLQVPLTAFAFISGAVAIGVGFGAQNLINNFISGWILMSERPIRIDDFIEIDGMSGTVERIGNRSTRIRRTDGVHLLVPNSALLEKTVVNWTLIDHSIRSIVRVGVAYGSPVKKASELMLQAVNEQEGIKADPAPSVVFEDFGDNALILDAYYWRDADSERDLRRMASDIRHRIFELLTEHDIEIAFPQRDVHIDAAATIPVRVIHDD